MIILPKNISLLNVEVEANGQLGTISWIRPQENKYATVLHIIAMEAVYWDLFYCVGIRKRCRVMKCLMCLPIKHNLITT